MHYLSRALWSKEKHNLQTLLKCFTHCKNILRKHITKKNKKWASWLPYVIVPCLSQVESRVSFLLLFLYIRLSCSIMSDGPSFNPESTLAPSPAAEGSGESGNAIPVALPDQPWFLSFDQPSNSLIQQLESVRATVERLSRDLAGDPKHIYNHKYDRKAHLAGDPKRKG